MEKKSDIIEFNGVSYAYDVENGEAENAVSDINIGIKRGDFVVVLGHNGSGKSTLAKLMNAILLPTHGKVFADGLDTSDEELIYDVRRRVGMVFQNPDNQIVATIVEDDVAFGPENLGVEPSEIRVRVDDALKAVDMYEYRLREPHKLSGGQKQRVAIAGVIAMQTDCIVFDEPTAMLDPRGREEVMRAARRLNRETGVTVVFITHFMEEAVEADRVIVMSDSKIILDAPPHEVFSHRDIIEGCGLSVPQSAKLAGLISDAGVKIADGILSVEECADALFAAAKEAGV